MSMKINISHIDNGLSVRKTAVNDMSLETRCLNKRLNVKFSIHEAEVPEPVPVVTYTITVNHDIHVNVIGTVPTSVDSGDELTVQLSASTGYNISSVTVKMGGATVTGAYNNGVVHIAHVTGNVVISAASSIITFTITNYLGDVTSNNPAVSITYGSSYTAVLTVDQGYDIAASVTMGGETISAYTPATRTVYIASVTGNLVIEADAVQQTYTITNNLSNVINNNSGSTIGGGEEYLALLTAAEHYTISSVTILMNNVDVTQYYSNGVIDIPVVTGNIVITASAVASEVMLTQTLTHVTSSAQDGYVAIGSSLTVTYSEDSGYHIDSSQTKVYMGGVDVTSSVIGQSSTGIVMYISNVTGPVVVTVVAESVLPYDAVVEYLQGDGTAYINTGVKITSKTKFDIDLVAENPSSKSTYYLFGGRVGSGDGAMYVFKNSSGDFKWYFGTKNGTISGVDTNRVRCNNLNEARHLYVNSGHAAVTSQTFTTNVDFLLFAVNLSDGSPSNTRLAEPIYSAKIYDTNTDNLLRDYIPVRKNGIGYLYDKVSGQLFGNAAASGAFSYGNDV